MRKNTGKQRKMNVILKLFNAFLFFRGIEKHSLAIILISEQIINLGILVI